MLRSESERIQASGGGSASRTGSIDGVAVAVLQSGQGWGRTVYTSASPAQACCTYALGCPSGSSMPWQAGATRRLLRSAARRQPLPGFQVFLKEQGGRSTSNLDITTKLLCFLKARDWPGAATTGWVLDTRLARVGANLRVSSSNINEDQGRRGHA